MVNINFTLSVLIQVTCVFIFLTIFYFTYATTKEADIAKSNTTFMINDLFGINANILPESFKKILLSKVNSINPNDPSIVKQDAGIDTNNEAVKKKAYNVLKIVSGTVIILVIISLNLSKKGTIPFFRNLKLGSILKETFIILFFVALTEYMFLTYIISKWISIDPNVIKAHLFDNLAKGFGK